MIFRKPYAVLIKFFKPLNFMITVLLVYVSLKFYSVYNFLSQYVKTGYYNFVADLPSVYINSFMYLAIIINLIIVVLILLLLTIKKKPTILYWIIFIVSMVSFFFLFKLHGNLALLELNNIEIRSLIITRDISVVIAVLGVLLAFCTFARSLGFDVKRFEFQKDIKQLRIEAMDNEEFEVDIDIDKNDIKTRFKRFFRKLKYYIVENKKILLVIVIIGLIVVSSGIYINKEIINKVYKEQESIVADDIGYKVINTYVTTKDYKGNDISDNTYAYVIVKLEILNNSSKATGIDIDNVLLTINKTSYNAILTSYDNFIDLGIGYVRQSVKSLNNATYIITFKIDKSDKSDKMYLKLSTTTGKKKVKLEPTIFNVIATNATYSLNEEMKMSSSVLRDSTFKVLDYEIGDSFKYTIGEQTITVLPRNLKSKSTVLRLNSIFELSSGVNINEITNKQFINYFMGIQYILEGNNIQVEVSDLTPADHSENYTYLEVPNDIKNATKISLIFVIRDQKYVYQIKG